LLIDPPGLDNLFLIPLALISHSLHITDEPDFVGAVGICFVMDGCHPAELWTFQIGD
jgi:hypothetical protein